MLDSMSRKKSNLKEVIKTSRQQRIPESNRASKDLRVITDRNLDMISHNIVVKEPTEFWGTL